VGNTYPDKGEVHGNYEDAHHRTGYAAE